MYLKRTAVKQAESALALYRRQRQHLVDETAEARQAIARLEQERETSLHKLAANLLPVADRPVVERVCQELGSTALQGVLNRAESLREKWLARIQAIEQDPEYAHRGRLMCPHRGPYTTSLEQARIKVTTAQKDLSTYDFEPFQWLYGRGLHQKREVSGFSAFIRAVALINYREQRALERVVEVLGDREFAQHAAEFERIEAGWQEARAEETHWREKVDYILGLMAEKDRLDGAVGDYEQATLAALRERLVAVLGECNLDKLHEHIRPAGRVAVAQCHAIHKKIKYLNDEIHWLAAEIADRTRRTDSITAAITRWKRKPYGMLYSNKAKWLVQVPEMKQESTLKRINWLRTMRHNLVGFTDYFAYSVLLREMGDALLAFDVFGMAAGTRMPYEGFTREVIGELELARCASRQLKADYSSYKRVIAEHDEYVETRWEVWDDADDYETDAAEALALDWQDTSDFADHS